MKKIIVGVLSVLIAAFATTGHAQMRPGAISIAPYVGGYTFEGNEDLKSGFVYGLRGGYDFTKNLGIEGFFNYMPTEKSSVTGNPSVKLYGFGLEGLYHFMPEGRFVPFVALGAGGSRYSASGGLSDRDRFTVDYGAGMKFFLTDNLALRADVRHVILPLNDRFNELFYTVGLHFLFGGERKPAPAAVDVQAAEPAAPVEIAVDSDGDGVVDKHDRCPGTPAGIQVDKDGCPLDSDRDGVYDYLDKCPETPEGVKVDKDGCPVPVEQKITPQAASLVEKVIIEKGRVTLNVEFDTAKATIRKASQEEIGRLAAVMKKYSDLQVLIEGHTDNVGNAGYNVKLSQRRAQAVKNDLVTRYGIEASRLKTKGYGLTKPVASNKTPEGRQKNRRVEAVAEYTIKK